MAFSKDVVILHEGRSCPKLQNPLFQKVKENLLPESEGYSLDDGFSDSALWLRAE